MLLNLWHYFGGYVVIEVSGFSVERFVNLAVHKGVYIWDVRYQGNKVTMNVSVKGFKRLKECARKTKCRFRIIEKRGYPFVAHRYRKRKIFLGGVLFFVMALYGLSSFVWLIEVEGNDRIEQSAIIDFCNQQGLKKGAFKHTIGKKDLEQAMIQSFSDISFLNISIKGTKATITLTETLPPMEEIDRETPCDIIAARDGIIQSVYTSAGTPKVREGDVVTKGDLLVSAQLLASEDVGGGVLEYVHAKAQVRAKLYHYIQFSVENSYTQKIYTGETKTRRRLNLFDKDINLFNYSISYENYDKITKRNQLSLGEDYPLPVILITEEYQEYRPVTVQRSLDQMKELAEIMVTSRIIREFDFESDITEKIIHYTPTNKGIDINATIVTIEDIGEERQVEAPLLPGDENSEDRAEAIVQ